MGKGAVGVEVQFIPGDSAAQFALFSLASMRQCCTACINSHFWSQTNERLPCSRSGSPPSFLPGEVYLHRSAIRLLSRCATTLLMGCSSGKLTAKGDYEPQVQWGHRESRPSVECCLWQWLTSVGRVCPPVEWMVHTLSARRDVFGPQLLGVQNCVSCRAMTGDCLRRFKTCSGSFLSRLGPSVWLLRLAVCPPGLPGCRRPFSCGQSVGCHRSRH